jgi:hypothetical protein
MMNMDDVNSKSVATQCFMIIDKSMGYLRRKEYDVARGSRRGVERA